MPASPAAPHRLRRRIVAGLVAVAGVLVLAAGAVYGYARYRYGQVHKVDIGRTPTRSARGTMNILLAGDNCRACLNGTQANAFGTGAQVGGGRSDVTMVVHLDLTHHRASLLSVPRDLFLPVPGTARANRVDASLNNGPRALVATIEKDLGIPIDHYVSVNFDTFQNVINALGGVDMYFPDPVYDNYSALHITSAGCHHLDGFEALAVVRSRHLYYRQDGTWHYDGFGDLSRIKRDHAFLQVLASAVEHKGLSNPFTLNSIVGTVAPQLQVDSAMSMSTMISLVRDFRSVNPASVPTYTLPVVVDPDPYYYRGADYGTVVFPDYPADQQAIDAFLGRAAPPGRPAALSSISVAVLDGTGGGQAATTASALGELGYRVTGTASTTPVGNPAEAVVYYDRGHLADALALAGHLTGLVAVAPEPGTVAPAGSSSSSSSATSTSTTEEGFPSGADLTVVTGTGFGVATPSTTMTTTTTTTTTLGANLGTPTPSHAALPHFDPTACPATR